MNAKERINQSQFYDLITGEELSWQAIIYDLIKTEQLNPWDIDLSILADRYLDILQQLEEQNFFVSSKVLFACSLLLRLKSEILANRYIQDLNDELYGKKEVQQTLDLSDFQIDENELPILVPKTPMARSKKVTLEQLMKALNQAIHTENRRIKREIKTRQAEKFASVVLPKSNRIPLKVRIKKIFSIIQGHLSISGNTHIKFHSLAQEKEEKLASFLPLLHLSNENKIYLRQIKHFDDIHITEKPHPEEHLELVNHLGLNEKN